MCLCFYLYMLYITWGRGLYIQYLYMSKKHIIGLNIGLKKRIFSQNDICLYVFMFLGMLH